MAAGAWLFTNGGRAKLLDGTLRTGDTYKMALFLDASNIGAASTTFAGLTNEAAGGTGYTAGGKSVTITVTGTTTVTVDADDQTWTASGGDIVARYAVIYEVGGNVLCYSALDAADLTATDGNPFAVTINASGVFTLH